MCPGHYETAAAADELITNNLGLRAVKKLAVKDLFKLRITAWDSVADHSAISRNVSILSLVPLHYLDPE
jgi:hypothetical protein